MLRVTLDGEKISSVTSGNSVDGIEVPAEFEDLVISRPADILYDGEKFVVSSTVTDWHVDQSGRKWLRPSAGRELVHCQWSDELVLSAEGWRPKSDDEKLSLSRVKAKAQLDAEAERQRMRWSTPGEGQAATYAAQREEAKAFLANTKMKLDDVPYISSLIGIVAPSAKEVAELILASSEKSRRRDALINAERLKAKAAINSSTTEEQVEAALKSPTWPED